MPASVMLEQPGLFGPSLQPYQLFSALTAPAEVDFAIAGALPTRRLKWTSDGPGA